MHRRSECSVTIRRIPFLPPSMTMTRCPAIGSSRRISKVNPGIETRLFRSISPSPHCPKIGFFEVRDMLSSFYAAFLQASISTQKVSGTPYSLQMNSRTFFPGFTPETTRCTYTRETPNFRPMAAAEVLRSLRSPFIFAGGVNLISIVRSIKGVGYICQEEFISSKFPLMPDISCRSFLSFMSIRYRNLELTGVGSKFGSKFQAETWNREERYG